jgi:putative oxygen-independent coproporphyrinogen III oxidase
VTGATAPAQPGPPALGLYVHVPFCEVKCAYCHFAIDPRRPDDARQERYLQAVRAEMAAAEPGPADTLYLGGGTPSLVSVPRLARLLEAARERFGLPASAEVTLEANPRDLDLAGYRALRAAGVNRLSLGVQSFDDAVLREMGRPHVAADARTAVERARAAGFSNLSLDLILGWPGETRERWSRSLAGVGALQPEHVSLYVLEVEGRTALAHRTARGGLTLPDDDLVADLYQEAVEALAGRGLQRYEISNFARAGFESRHNASTGTTPHSWASACRPTATVTAGAGGTTPPTRPTARPWSGADPRGPWPGNGASVRVSEWGRRRSPACAARAASTSTTSAGATEPTCSTCSARAWTRRSAPGCCIVRAAACA